MISLEESYTKVWLLRIKIQSNEGPLKTFLQPYTNEIFLMLVFKYT